MYRRNRTTRTGGIPLPDDPAPAKAHGSGARPDHMVRALLRLARSHRRLSHVPTPMQVRALAHFDGCEPSSYLLDPTVNYVPELPLGGDDALGRHGLCFTGRHPDSGRPFELVTLPDGGAFDLLGIAG